MWWPSDPMRGEKAWRVVRFWWVVQEWVPSQDQAGHIVSSGGGRRGRAAAHVQSVPRHGRAARSHASARYSSSLRPPPTMDAPFKPGFEAVVYPQKSLATHRPSLSEPSSVKIMQQFSSACRVLREYAPGKPSSQRGASRKVLHAARPERRAGRVLQRDTKKASPILQGACRPSRPRILAARARTDARRPARLSALVPLPVARRKN